MIRLNVLKLTFLLAVVLFGDYCAGLAQNPSSFIGVPFLKNFIPEQNGIMGKIWEIHAAPNGIIYMASDNGLVEFDGLNWNQYRSSFGATRSVFVLNDSTIFTGSDRDFGVWKRNKFQVFEYSSLYPKKNQNSETNEEFSQIHFSQNRLIFVSSTSLYIYENQVNTIISALSEFTGSFLVDDTVYIADRENGIFKLSDLKWSKVANWPQNSAFDITGIYSDHTNVKVLSKQFGLFTIDSGNLVAVKDKLSDMIQSNKVVHFLKLNDSYLGFGTVQKGLFITDLKGNLIHFINKNKGLLSNTILNMYSSNSGKLWLGLDFGVVFIDLNATYSFIQDFRGDFGTGYTSLWDNNQFFLGTNQGLYQTPWKALLNNVEHFDFQIIKDSEGKVWDIKKIKNHILVAHDNGLFVLEDKGLKPIFDKSAVFTLQFQNEKLFAGTKNGITIFSQVANQWKFENKMDSISGSVNQLFFEKDNVLWVNLLNYGLIRVTLDSSLNPIDQQIFLKNRFSGDVINLGKKDDKIYVLTNQFQYQFDGITSSFVQEMEQSEEIHSDFIVSQNTFQLTPDYQFFSMHNGFALKRNQLNLHASKPKQNLLLRKSIAFNNEHSQLISENAVIHSTMNNIKLEVVVPFSEKFRYKFKLDSDGVWSNPTKDGVFEVVNIPYGKHQIWIKAQQTDSVLNTMHFDFEVSAPWYRTGLAYMAYITVFSVIVILLRFYQKIALEKQKKEFVDWQNKSFKEQAEKHEQLLNQIEQERLKHDFEQLKNQLKVKTIDLANKSKQNEEKTKLILTIKEKFEQLQKEPDPLKIKFGEINRMLNSFINLEDKTFEIQMDELHQDFFNKMQQQFPLLSSNDIRLCVYIKLGFNSKEIADLLNILPSSVYISRSRLRKKMDLEPDSDLFQFLNKI